MLQKTFRCCVILAHSFESLRDGNERFEEGLARVLHRKPTRVARLFDNGTFLFALGPLGFEHREAIGRGANPDAQLLDVAPERLRNSIVFLARLAKSVLSEREIP